MTAARPVRKELPRELDPAAWPQVDAAGEITRGLLGDEPMLSPKYLYDSLGSRLFEAITELPEYYPTRTEAAIFQAHVGAMARAIGAGCTLIELGAGNGEKAAALFDALRPAQYVAIDISAEFLDRSIAALQRAHPALPMVSVAGDLTAGVRLPESVNAKRRTFLYLGSSIGNFDPAEAQRMLADVRRQCDREGGLLIGVDLVKPADVLNAAYDDALGVTAAFNLNVLNNVNALIGANFRLHDWIHRARFNASRSRVEMHLEARREVVVAWPGGSRHFQAGDRIHTESSYKYRLGDFEQLLRRAGFQDVNAWTDERGWFAVCQARAGSA